jgi:cephalosporin-C deacetylase-like acetyl esterase
MRSQLSVLAASAFLLSALHPARAADPTNAYLSFVRVQASILHEKDVPPQTAPEWNQRKAALRDRLGAAWGDPQTRFGKLEVQRFGELARDGYRIEKLAIQTFRGVWMTANAYVPSNPAGKIPALLMVHGHWRGAKQDPVVQARCIGAVRKGFFVLVVDAFGAGERGVGKALGEYHGDMTAATLLPVGLPLSGLQVAENTRAVDYLATRPEVDPTRIGITGASGGGNQTMYAGAWDDRFRAVAPVCSVGNYQAYLGAACCYCELVPAALRFTEEWAILGMTAPRALLVINATRDSRQFSVEEAKVSLEKTAAVYETLGQPANLRHTIFDSGHDYSKPMREAVYGWMAFYLKNQGDSSPILEEPFQPEDPETLRCFPGDSRPDNWITIPKFADAEGRRLLAARDNAPAKSPEELRKTLAGLLGDFPSPRSSSFRQLSERIGQGREMLFSPEPGITLKARCQPGNGEKSLLILLDLEGAAAAAKSPVATVASNAGWNVVTMDLRATGELAWNGDKIGRAPDHTTAQWAFWIGRPLLGQWVWDVHSLVDAIQDTSHNFPTEIAIAGIGPAGIVALAAAALDDRITRVATFGTLATLVTDVPYEKQRMGILVPGILKQFGDVSALAALAAPKPLLISGGVRPDGRDLEPAQLPEFFKEASSRYTELSRAEGIQFASKTNEQGLRAFFKTSPSTPAPK